MRNDEAEGVATGMGTQNSIRRRIEKLERCRELFDPAPGFDAYEKIGSLALSHLSDEELKILIRVKEGLNQGRKLDRMGLTDEELRALMVADSSLRDARQKEFERFGITVAQCEERRGLARPAVEHLKQLYIENRRSEISFRNLQKGRMRSW
jgi:hypothetical protein